MPKRQVVTEDMMQNARKSQRLTYLSQIADIPRNELDEDNIAVLPPDPDVLSDEENADDDDVVGEIELIDLTEANFDVKNLDWSGDTDDPEFRTFPNFPDDRLSSENLVRMLGEKSPIDVFDKLIAGLLELVTEQSKLYANQSNFHDFKCDQKDYRVFLGVLLLSGYHVLPQQTNYWSDDGDLGVEAIKRTMTKNRFLELKRFLHFADNTVMPEDCTDRYYKIRPLINLLNENFMTVAFLHNKFSIDEKMIEYFGRNKLKQYIRGKPIRFGYKVWALCCAVTGYCYTFEPYQGKADNSKEPLGKRVIKNLSQHLPEGSELYFDNFFTSIPTVYMLSGRNIKTCATMRANRIGSCDINLKELEKDPRGSMSFSYAPTVKIGLTAWKDNRIVSVCSNFLGKNPIHDVTRRQKGATATIQIPDSVFTYKKFMGGVDLSDWCTEKYRISIGGKKWYFKIFTYLLDMAEVNAWCVYRVATKSSISHFEFRRKVALALLATESASRPKNPGRPSTTSYTKHTSEEVRLSGKHYIERTDNGRQRVCALCKKQVRKQCAKCDVGMHVDCFPEYHK